MNRRTFLGAAAAAWAGLAAGSTGAPAAKTPPVLKPRRLAPGDAVALVAPASATFNTVDVEIARESLQALGLEVIVGEHVLARHGYLAGTDEARAADINRFFGDENVRAVLPIRGGWGSSRLLPYLDYDLIRRNPKVVLGFSDVTALLLAIHAQTGLVTFHGPNGVGRWDGWSVDYLRRVLFEAEAVVMENRRELSERNSLTPIEHRIRIITPGRARGPLLGGNLTVLTTIIGSPYLPPWDGAIFFTEDVDEAPYRVDRMVTQLKLAGILQRLGGFVFGTCADCRPGEGFASLTLEEIFNDHVRPLGIPAWQGAMIGHQTPQFTIPLGIQAEVDAVGGTIRMLEPAVL